MKYVDSVMSIRNLVLIACLALGVLGEDQSYNGSYTTSEGYDIEYGILNTDTYSLLLLTRPDDPAPPLLSVRHSKGDGKITLHLTGYEPITSADTEEEARMTAEFMTTNIGRSLPELSSHVFEEHGVFGYENDGMMLLHQLAMFSHNFHAEKRRKKRNVYTNDVVDFEERGNNIEDIFPAEIVEICEGELLSQHGGCSSDLAVVGGPNECEFRKDEGFIHQFEADEVAKGCYGLCGPWCTCWHQICGDCCWHPGCDQHDHYCDDPKSKECRLGKGVVYGTKGLHKC